jgi:hypothetical protein
MDSNWEEMDDALLEITEEADVVGDEDFEDGGLALHDARRARLELEKITGAFLRQGLRSRGAFPGWKGGPISIEAVLRGFDWWLGGNLIAAWRATFRPSLLQGFHELGENVPMLQDFLEVAMRVLAISSSEADCERLIWQQRRVLCPSSCHMSDATLMNRVRARVLGIPNSAAARREIAAQLRRHVHRDE